MSKSSAANVIAGAALVAGVAATAYALRDPIKRAFNQIASGDESAGSLGDDLSSPDPSQNPFSPFNPFSPYYYAGGYPYPPGASSPESGVNEQLKNTSLTGEGSVQSPNSGEVATSGDALGGLQSGLYTPANFQDPAAGEPSFFKEYMLPALVFTGVGLAASPIEGAVKNVFDRIRGKNVRPSERLAESRRIEAEVRTPERQLRTEARVQDRTPSRDLTARENLEANRVRETAQTQERVTAREEVQTRSRAREVVETRNPGAPKETFRLGEEPVRVKTRVAETAEPRIGTSRVGRVGRVVGGAIAVAGAIDFAGRAIEVGPVEAGKEFIAGNIGLVKTAAKTTPFYQAYAVYEGGARGLVRENTQTARELGSAAKSIFVDAFGGAFGTLFGIGEALIGKGSFKSTVQKRREETQDFLDNFLRLPQAISPQIGNQINNPLTYLPSVGASIKPTKSISESTLITLTKNNSLSSQEVVPMSSNKSESVKKVSEPVPPPGREVKEASGITYQQSGQTFDYKSKPTATLTMAQGSSRTVVVQSIKGNLTSGGRVSAPVTKSASKTTKAKKR